MAAPSIGHLFRDLFAYIKCPFENTDKSYRVNCILSSLFVFAVIYIGVNLLYGLIVFLLQNVPSIQSSVTTDLIPKANVPLLLVAVLGPILEESQYRLCLERKNIFILVAIILTVFDFVSCCFFTKQYYSFDRLIPRIAISVSIGTILFFLLRGIIRTCNYKKYFYFWCIFFGVMHFWRVDFSTMLPLDYVIMGLFLSKQTVAGLLLGYIRMKHGFVTGTAVHMTINLLNHI